MTKKEKELVEELIKYSKAMVKGHYGIKECVTEAIEKLEPYLKK